MRTLADVSVCIGGTDVAQKVIAQSGFKPIGEMQFYSRPLRPFYQCLTHQRRNLKLPARWVRNLIWAQRYGHAVPGGWTAEPIEPDQILAEVLPVSAAKSSLANAHRRNFDIWPPVR